MTALFRRGEWFFQKFHTKEQAIELAERFGLRFDKYGESTGWQIEATKVRELPDADVNWAIDYEFNLPVGKDRRLERHNDVRAAVAKMRARAGG